MRRFGVLLPISSLPNSFGIGCFSKEAYEFVDFLKEAGSSFWQILPLGPTGYGDSPYQSFSTFAGNPYFIDLQEFIDRDWLSVKECSSYDYGQENYVEYEAIYKSRRELLRKAFERSNIENEEEFKAFIKENEFWLKDYGLYMAIKDKNKNVSWLLWPEELKKREADACKRAAKELEKEMLLYYFQQYFFYKQWDALKAYANSCNIKIIGDIPIYVAEDSADTWSDPEEFQLDKELYPLAVAGCPPDYFSPLGQLWGNPLYNWEYHKKTGYKWWINRMKQCYRLYDIVKIDHFRGFDEYYSIPAGRKDAVVGSWKPGPGYELFETLEKSIGKNDLIIEDLGFMTKSVRRLVKKVRCPNMKVFSFGFDGTGNSEHLPHNYAGNCVAYTGTHDNDTVLGWYKSLKKKDKQYVQEYFGEKTGSKICKAMIRELFHSPADTVIIPMQDFLGLPGECRINTPSTLGNNWKWRLGAGQFDRKLMALEIYTMARGCGRVDIPIKQNKEKDSWS